MNILSKCKVLLVIIAQFIALTSFFQQSTPAKEYEENIGESKPRNIAKIIRPSDVSDVDLKKIKKITVLVSSTSPLFGQVAEDLLAIKLRDKNLEVAAQTKVTELTAKELNRIKNQAGKEGEERQEEILDVVSLGRKLGSDAVFVGTLFEGRRQFSFPEGKPPTLMEKIVVSTFYLQVVDMRTEKVTLAVILEYDKGENITNAVDTMTKLIINEIKD